MGPAAAITTGMPSSSHVPDQQPRRRPSVHTRIRRFWLAVALSITTSVILAAIWFSITPTPSILLLRNAFRQQELTKPAGFTRVKAGVTVVHNPTYPSRYGRNTFDLYEPTKKSAKPLPVIVWAHGGGFIAGDKASMETYATLMANEGYAVVTVNYDYAPDGTYPTPVIQMGEMVDYVSTIASRRDLDPTRIIVGGDSAGAQIAAQFVVVNTTPGYSQWTHIAKTSLSSPLKGAILFCGPYDLESSAAEESSVVKKWFINTIGWGYLGRRDWKDSTELDEATIVNHIFSNFPPTYVTDGNLVSFPDQGRSLVERLTDAKVSVKSRFFPDEPSLPHEFQFDFAYPESGLVWNDVSDFLTSMMK